MSSATLGVGRDQLAAATRRARLADFASLTKPRITMMVMLTTLSGYLAGAPGAPGTRGSGVDAAKLFDTLLGTALAAAAANALNQLVEREADAQMRRTARRPLPAGRLLPGEAAAFGLALALVGPLYLWATVGALASALAAATVASYVLLYTPLKKVTSLATVIGAVPGAIPPVIGWAAAQGRLGVEPWILAAIVFFWQMPHFLAIAAIYRQDYRRAGFRVLPVVDPAGTSTGRQAALYGLALVPVSLLPTMVGMAGAAYFAGALLLGLGFVVSSTRLALDPTAAPKAKALFRFSLLYLPALLILLVLS